MPPIVDLSVPLDEDVAVFPGDPPLRTRPAATVAVEGFNVLHLAMGSQTGTHVDAPFHVRADGLRIDELPLDRFLGPLVVADVRGLGPRRPIGPGRLAPVRDRLRAGVALVLHTGWAAHRGTPAYFDHPYLTPDAAAQLLDAGVRTVGIDAPNLDPTVLDGTGPAQLPVHQLVAAADGVLVENLTGLEQVDRPGAWLSVLPLRLAGADGAPCRAVAFWPGNEPVTRV
ncbi:cyclase family protein [Blastococcus sp. SYSU DS0539]